MGLAGPATIDMHWDWVGAPLLIPMGMAGPATINMHWDWVGPLLLISNGLAGLATIIGCFWIGLASHN
jgi:hypothetical protein